MTSPLPQGLEKAKEAVALAPEDPLNWETPGPWGPWMSSEDEAHFLGGVHRQQYVR
jgi:hypothetical protein